MGGCGGGTVVRALFPGSFDPITNGHLDIIRRAAGLFDVVIAAVYATPRKDVLFSVEERVEMVRQAVADIPNVEVCTYTGLTVDCARAVGARAIIRGLRAISDFEYELEMAHMNRELAPELETVCLMTTGALSFVRSSRIREVAALGGDISEFVPPHVAEQLRRRFALAPSGSRLLKRGE